MTSLHGPQDRRKKSKRILSKPHRTQRDPWHKRGLSRADRVIAFLEALPITKGILAGKRMKLLPGQRKFVRAIYGRLGADGRRQIRLAIKSEPRGNGKTGLLAGLALCHLLGPECEARGEIYSAAFLGQSRHVARADNLPLLALTSRSPPGMSAIVGKADIAQTGGEVR
jgi:phage terminase large subunit-like protein